MTDDWELSFIYLSSKIWWYIFETIIDNLSAFVIDVWFDSEADNFTFTLDENNDDEYIKIETSTYDEC